MATGSPKNTPHSKSRIANRFYLDTQLLGRGGTSDVYVATDGDQDGKRESLCVAKLLRSDLATPQTIQRFHQEAKISRNLPSNCVVQLLDAGDMGEQFFHCGKQYASYQILEYMAGGTLDRFLRSHERKLSDTVEMMHKIAKAVGEVHDAGIVHRDLKPSNILLDDAKHSKLADFGIAVNVHAPSDLTCTGEIPGTPNYLSPEQATGENGAVCFTSDVFSLGIVFYELLAAVHPFHAASAHEVRSAIIKYDPAMLRWQARQVDARLNAIVMMCLEKNPKRRYANASELAKDLGRYLDDEQVQAPIHGIRRQAVRWTKRHRFMSFAAIALIAVTSFAVYSIWLRGQLKQSLRHEYQARAEITQQSQRPGQRTETLATIQKATGLFPGGQVPQSLMDEAVIAFSTTDAIVLGEWEFDPAGFSISPCFQFLAHVSPHKDILVSRLSDQEVVCKIPADGVIPLKTAFSHSGKFLLGQCLEKDSASGGERVLRIWNVENGERLQFVPARISSNAFAFHPHQERLAYSTYDHYVHVLDLAEGKQLGPYLVNDTISHLCFHPSSNLIAMSGQVAVHILDRDTGKSRVYPITTRHDDWLGDIGWSPDGSLLAVALDERILLIDATTGAQRGLLAGHKGRVERVQFANQHSLLASFGWDKTMRLWDINSERLLLSDSGCGSLQFSADDSYLAGSSRDGNVGYWEIKRPESHQTFGHHRGTIHDWFNVTTGPHGLWASSGSDGAYLFTSNPRMEPRRLTALPTSMCLFHPNGHGVFTTHRGMIFFWPLEVTNQNGESVLLVGRPALYQRDHDDFSRISFDGTGSHLAIASQSDGLQILSLAENSDRQEVNTDGDHHLVTLSHDARWVATTGPNGKATRVWSTRKAVDVAPVDVESGSPLFSPDGTVLLTAKQNEYVFWEVGSWKPLRRVPCHSTQPRVGAFANSSRFVALLIDEDVVQIASREDYRPLLHLRVPGGQPIQSLQFSKNDRSLAVSTQGGVIHVWRLDHLIDELELLGISPRQLRSMQRLVAGTKGSASVTQIISAKEGVATGYPPSWIVPEDRKQWLWQQAKTSYRAKLWQDSAGFFGDYLEVIPNEWVAHLYRGGAQARLGQWQQAKDSYRHVVRMGRRKARARDWHSLAILQLRDGDQKNYQSTCRDVFEIFFQHENHSDVANLLQTCILAPDCGRDYALLLERADQLSEEIVGTEWKMFLIGALQYRLGNVQVSYDTLNALSEQNSDYPRARAKFFQTMACYRLRRREEAQTLIQEADAWMASLSKRPTYWGDWEEWLLFRKEVQTLQATASLPKTAASP